MKLSQLLTLASALSALRLVLAGVLPLFPPEFWVAVYAVAILTDVLDGPVARRTGVACPAGATLDAWADKALHVNTAWALVLGDVVPSWWLLLWFIREIIQLPMVFIFAHRWRTGVGMPATRPLGQATSISLAATIALALVGIPSLWATVLVGALGLAAGMDYARLHFSTLRLVEVP